MEQRLEFAPPQPPGFGRAATLALLAHLLLLAGLTVSVQWKRDADPPAIEAELWSAVPTQAAPRPVEPPPPPPAPPPAPAPKPVAAPPPPDPQVLKDAQIAMERDKQKRLAEQKRQEQLQALAQQKLAQAKAEQAAKDKQAQEKREKAEQDKRQAEKKQAEEKARKREAEERQEKAEKAEKADKAKTAASKAQAEADRKKQLERVMGLAGATGESNATGTSQRSSGPSASYAGKVAARIKANIVFPDDIPGNPMAEVEFRTAPDGSIVGTPRLVKSSGFKAWDDAVIKAILKTETLPRDIDGRIPSSFSIGLKPKE